MRKHEIYDDPKRIAAVSPILIHDATVSRGKLFALPIIASNKIKNILFILSPRI